MPEGIACTILGPNVEGAQAVGTCTKEFSGVANVVLTAVGLEGWPFAGWDVPGCGTGVSCAVPLDAPQVVRVRFGYVFPLTVAGVPGRQGAGTITSRPTGITCIVTAGGLFGFCSSSWPQGTIIQLTAVPEPGSRLAAWSSPCTGYSCSVMVDGETLVHAAFDLVYALRFDSGQLQFAEIADSPSLDLSSEWTIEAWIWQETINSNLHIISKWGTAPEASYVLEANMGYLRLATNDGVNASTVLEENTVAMPTHTWTHIAASYSAGVARLYINGIEVAQGAMSQPANSSQPLSFGREGPPLNSRYFDGRLDEVRIWSVARSQSQIAGAMNAVLSAPAAGLVGYWRLDEATGQVLHDLSGAGNDGLLGGGLSTAMSDPTWISSTAPVE